MFTHNLCYSPYFMLLMSGKLLTKIFLMICRWSIDEKLKILKIENHPQFFFSFISLCFSMRKNVKKILNNRQIMKHGKNEKN